MFWPRIISILSALWFLFFLELAVRYPSRLLSWETAALAGPLFFLAALLFKVRKQNLSVHRLGAPLAFLLSGAFLLLIFVDRSFSRQILIAVVSLFVYLELFYLALFVFQAKGYPVGGLEQLNVEVLVLSFLLFSFSLFGWLTFLAKNFWPVLLAEAVLSFLIFLEIFFSRKIEGRMALLPALFLTVLATEFFWAVALWPVGFFAKGLIFFLASLYLFYLSASQLAGRLSRQKAVGYFLAASLLIVVTLAMARWI